MHVCYTLHNFILDQNQGLTPDGDDREASETGDTDVDNEIDLANVIRPYTQRERDEWQAFRDNFANRMWQEYQFSRMH